MQNHTVLSFPQGPLSIFDMIHFDACLHRMYSYSFFGIPHPGTELPKQRCQMGHLPMCIIWYYLRHSSPRPSVKCRFGRLSAGFVCLSVCYKNKRGFGCLSAGFGVLSAGFAENEERTCKNNSEFRGKDSRYRSCVP